MKRQSKFDPCTITAAQIQRGSDTFRKKEKRDSIYKTAKFLVKQFWGDHKKTSDALGVLLLTWNNAFYRYGIFSFDSLEKTLDKNFEDIKTYRRRKILEHNPNDDDKIIKKLFNSFLRALQQTTKNGKKRKSPVAVAKALHLLAPNFFPLWDRKIAKKYSCNYDRNPVDAYLKFMKKNKEMAEKFHRRIRTKGATLLKVFDEYNYSKFTKNWP